ncbi:hypothetical protein [Dyella sp.]|uniref:hypothetical protein n=1 Tax=Dyella sp. TaxID=1869338 RepID=UPI002FDA9569
MALNVEQSQGWRLVAIVMTVILVLHSPLIFNPGYLSHDELQWAFQATEHKGPAFINGLWADVQAFQYRPLTFSLWMWLSRRCFDHPFLFHAIIVAVSAWNASMLALVLRKAGASGRTAVLAGLLFGLGPYATYTHGWVATLADLIWVFCTLAIALITISTPRRWPVWLASFGLTCTALLAKESGVVLPALFLLAWLFDRRRPVWLDATFFAAVPVIVYLGIRLHTLLTGAPADSPYAWHLSTIPLNWIKYQLYPIAIDKFGAAEVRTLWYVVLIWCLLLLSLWKAAPRYALAFLAFGTAALGPVLIVQPAAWYGYALSAVIAAVTALSWPRMHRWGRFATALFVALALLHSINLMRVIHDAGEKQSRFSPALAQAVQDGKGKAITLSVENEKDRWIYIRMTHDIHAYHGVKMDGFVKLVGSEEPADYQVQADGSLKPLR